MIICFTGIDGSGKTMQARLLVDRLNAEGYPARYVWTGGRAYLSRPLIWLAKRVLRAPKLGKPSKQASPAAPATPADKSAQYRSYLASTRKLFKNPLVRRVWRHISLVEHTAEILVVALPHLLRGRIIVCDRYIYDSMIGLAVLAGVQPAELPDLLRIPAIYCVPKPKKWFLIDIPASVAFNRRDDVVDVAFLEQRIPLYRTAAAMLGAQAVDGTPAPDTIANTVWENVRPLLRRTAATTHGEHPSDSTLPGA